MKLFTPKIIEKLTGSAIRKEYSRLRSIANKRIQRVEKAGLSRGLTREGLFPTIKEITKNKFLDIGSMLADVSRFVTSERTTVTGQRKFINDFKEEMTEKGYEDLVQTPDQIYNLLDYMEQLREMYSDKLFDSGDALDVLSETERLDIPIETVIRNYDLFAENLSELEEIETPKNGMKRKDVNSLINKWSR